MGVGLTNTGVDTVTFTSLSITGSGAADFVPPPLGACQALPPGITCGLPVVFAPQGPGTSTATLTIVSNAAGSPQTVSLNGNGLQGVLTIKPASPTFPPTPVGGASPLQSLLLINTGNATMIIGDLSFGPEAADFPMINPNACRLASVPPSGFCALEVGFTPQALGPRTETVTISSNASNSPQTVTLTGNGVAPTKILTLPPSPLTFPDTVVNQPSFRGISITNIGNTPVQVTGTSVSGPNAGDFFFLPLLCQSGSAIVAPGEACPLIIHFNPGASGPRQAMFTITSDATGSPQSVTLQGNGIAPTKILTIPDKVQFPDTPVGQSSRGRPISIQNIGNAPAHVTGISIGGSNPGDFAAGPLGCGLTPNVVPPGGACALDTGFNPTALGLRTATVTITSDATGSPQTLTLTGNGFPASLRINPNPPVFPDTGIGIQSPPQTLTVTNIGQTAVQIGATSLAGTNAGDFQFTTNGCTTPTFALLAPGANCTIGLTFDPQAAGPRQATLILISDGKGSPQMVPLAGNGVPGSLSLTPPNQLNFPPTAVAGTSAPLGLTITNLGKGLVTFSAISLGGGNVGDFQITTNHCLTHAQFFLFPNASCTLAFTFSPQAAGSRTTTLTITSDGVGSPQTVTLNGDGVPGSLSLTPNSLTFPPTGVGVQSPQQQTLTVKNNGPATVHFNSIGLGGVNASDFQIADNTCQPPGLLLANASCTLTFTFTPTAAGTRMAILTVASDGVGSPQQVTLTGNGIAPSATTPRFAYEANPDGTVSIFVVNPATGHLQSRGYATVPLTGSASAPSLALDPQNRFVFYGVANSVLPSSSIFTFTVDSATGALTPQPGPLTTSGSVSAVAVDPSGRFLYVAGGTSSAGHISAFSIDSTTGALSQITGSPFTAGTSPRMAVDPSGKFLYSGDSFGVSAFTIDPVTGALTPVAGSPFVVGGLPQPEAIAVDPKGRFVYFLSNSSVSAFAINGTSGVLTPVPGSPFAPSAPNLVSVSLAIDPTSTFLYVTNNSQVQGTSSISAYRLDATTGALAPITGSPFSAGTAEPFWVSVDPSGAFLYMPSFDTTAGGIIQGFSIAPGTGVLTPLGTTLARLFPHNSVQLAISTGTAPVTSTPQYVLVGNSGSNDVSAYNINPGSGTLTAVSGSPFLAGTSPVSVSTDILGRFAYVANSGSNDISAFGISPTTGTLAPVTGSPFPTGGTGVQSVVVDLSSEFVYAGNSVSQNISEFALNPATGALSAISGSPLGTSLSVTALSDDPTGQRIFAAGTGVANFALGNFYNVNVNGNPGSANPNGSLSFANSLTTGSALKASSVAVHPSGRFAYVTNLGSNNVTGMSLTCCQSAPVPGSPFPAGTSPTGVAIEPMGRFLYVANSGSNNVSAYSIDPATGTASPLAGSPFPAGTNPSALAVDGSGKFLLVTNKGDNTVSVFTIDSNTGALTVVTGSPFATGTAPAAVTVINKVQ